MQGRVLSAFFYGYICTQVLGAHWALLHGPKRVLLIGVAVWTLFDLLTIPTARTPTLLWFVRAEGILFPSLHVVAASWYPVNERSRLMSLVSSGVDLGTILSMAVAPLLLSAFGWPSIFVTFGGLSALWLVAFLWRGSSKPEMDKAISLTEKATILAQRDVFNHKLVALQAVSSRRLLTSRGAWAIYSAHFAFNFGWYVLLGWMPLYFREKLHVPVATSGFTSACPYIAGYIGVLVWGIVSDKWIQMGHKPLVVRKIMNAVGLVGAAVCFGLMRFTHSTAMAVVVLSLALFFGRAATLGYWVHMVDVSPTHAGHMNRSDSVWQIMGISNTIGTVPGIVGNIFTGWMLARSEHNWDIVFGVVAGVLLCGAAIFHVWATEHLDEDDNGSHAKKDYMNKLLLDDDDGLHLERDEFFI
ncbi:hypothetical protein DYB32_003427 [Aphanomyces invadans]|uniref:Major facilitator superfamily (MFS) profile domain-containing protein n=1 Tax=Aphanomyces invadans TaxID=157072 RepID=A0A418B0P2_9STRA|nr:hypothetical protein DYB32_003427 [Aphanomyces invadans]